MGSHLKVSCLAMQQVDWGDKLGSFLCLGRHRVELNGLWELVNG